MIHPCLNAASPVHAAASMVAPVPLIHDEEDTVVPVGQPRGDADRAAHLSAPAGQSARRRSR
jgi:hypothetical protein